MPFCNRVDPCGGIHAVPSRGLFTGNRGIIHDPETKTLLKRRWTAKAWIICALEHPRGTRREPMGRNGPGGGASWTELFFLDEVTALAAGHRPCFYCRRERAKTFFRACRNALGLERLSAPELDLRLHAERRLSAHREPAEINPDQLDRLPDGAMVTDGKHAFARRDGRLLPWNFDGYGTPLPIRDLGGATLRLLTPPTTVAALRAGYEPVWHDSAKT